MFDRIRQLLLFCSLAVTRPAIADSAAAWKAYQEGKNPLIEVGLLVIGIAIFFGLLVFINKAMNTRNKKKRKNNERRKNK